MRKGRVEMEREGENWRQMEKLEKEREKENVREKGRKGQRHDGEPEEKWKNTK